MTDPQRIPAQYMSMQGEFPPASSGVTAGSWRLNMASWALIQPERGRFTWSELDAWVRDTPARGGTEDLLLMIGLTPAWAAGVAPGPGGFSTEPPRDMSDWDAFVEAIAQRYRGKVAFYQVWNEASLTTFWTGTPDQMAELTARAYRIIHRVDPAAKVVSASAALRTQGSYGAFVPAYLQGLRTRGWPVDVFSAHFYPPSTGGPTTSAGYVRQFQQDLRAAGAPARPLWNTEINYGLAGPGPAYPYVPLSAATQAAYLAQTYLDGLRLGVERVYWYAQLPPRGFLGVNLWPGERSVGAWGTLQRWLVGSVWRGCVTKRTVHRCKTWTGSAGATILWTPGSAKKIKVSRGIHRVCDVLGRCRSVQPGTWISVGSLPVRMTR
ncbi:MAG: hypothetical protein R2737_12960 [Candidatus Nanopelagicales bacterium]